jgi:hypothetical protein
MSVTTDQIVAVIQTVTAYAASSPAAIKATTDAYISDTQAEIDSLIALIASAQAALAIHQTAIVNAKAFDPAYIAPDASVPAVVA